MAAAKARQAAKSTSGSAGEKSAKRGRKQKVEEQEAVEEESQYERDRRANIERNRLLMQSLGIDQVGIYVVQYGCSFGAFIPCEGFVVGVRVPLQRLGCMIPFLQSHGVVPCAVKDVLSVAGCRGTGSIT